MASRRLAISSLLCADDSDAAAASPSSHSSPDFSAHTPAVDTGVPGSYASSSKFSPISSWTSPSAEVVPMFVEHGTHLRRRTPSPSSQNPRLSTAYSAVTRRSFREVVFDNYTEQAASVTRHSANSPAIDTVDYPPRSQPSEPNYKIYPYSQERPEDYFVKQRDSNRSAECSYSTVLSRSASCGARADCPCLVQITCQPRSLLRHPTPQPSRTPHIN